VRYSFHGKMRFTGQMVDGFIEAANSMQAIDMLADEGVIGVYTVCPAPHQTKPRLSFDGNEAQQWDLPFETEAEPLIERLTNLIGQVEQIIASRPLLSGPVRAQSSLARRSRSNPVVEEKSDALRSIFETNMELRQSIKQLASANSSLRPNEKTQTTAPRELVINIPAQPAA
jgi:hypothetical protein